MQFKNLAMNNRKTSNAGLQESALAYALYYHYATGPKNSSTMLAFVQQKYFNFLIGLDYCYE